jgi:hypothetical protein
VTLPTLSTHQGGPEHPPAFPFSASRLQVQALAKGDRWLEVSSNEPSERLNHSLDGDDIKVEEMVQQSIRLLTKFQTPADSWPSQVTREVCAVMLWI